MKINFLTFVGIYVLLAISILPAQSLLTNGDFEQADAKNPNQPAHWDIIDGLGIQWANAPSSPGTPHGKCIRMNTDLLEGAMNASWTKVGVTKWIIPNPGGSISETYGLSLYSDAVPLVAGKAYKVTFDFMSEKRTAGKVWLRGYKNVEGEMRRLYETTIDCNSPGQWHTYTGLCHPTKHDPALTEFRVMLFAYYPAGVCWFDHVKVEIVEDNAAH